jgi:hypothetical protein
LSGRLRAANWVFGRLRRNRDCGFEVPRDRRVLVMLGFRDVNIANYGPDSRGSR